MLSEKTVYVGKKAHMSRSLIDSHMLELRDDGVVFEFEYTLVNRQSRVFEFAYHTIVLLLDSLCDAQNDDREDGLYRANESRMIDLVSEGMVYKYGERELASILFHKMH